MRRGIPTAVVALAVALMGASSAQAVQIGGGTLSAEVRADVKPDRLPRRGYAPASLIVNGKVNGTDALNAVELQLDGRLLTATTTKGLTTCKVAQVRSVPLAQARRRCGKALIGSGSIGRQFHVPETPVLAFRETVLLFHAAPGRILVYSYQPQVGGPGGFVPAAPVTSGTIKGRSIQLRFLRSAGGVTTSFQFRIGRTWRDRGQKRSLLFGRCAAGQFTNRVTLRFGRGVLTGAVADACRGR